MPVVAGAVLRVLFRSCAAAWGLVCALCSGLRERGRGALGECVGRVTCGFLRPTTEPPRGAQGVWSEALLD